SIKRILNRDKRINMSQDVLPADVHVCGRISVQRAPNRWGLDGGRQEALRSNHRDAGRERPLVPADVESRAELNRRHRAKLEPETVLLFVPGVAVYDRECRPTFEAPVLRERLQDLEPQRSAVPGLAAFV